jgi:hypothetical protein
VTVTRMQILDYVEEAFERGPITTQQMCDTAARKGPETEVLALLGEIPPRNFISPREIWPYLPELPVGA